MGGNQTKHIPVKSDLDSFVAVSICGYNSKVRVMNAPRDVHAMFIRLDQELTGKWGSTRGPVIKYYGTLKMKVGDWRSFNQGSGKAAGTIGKVFAVRCFEEMYKLGYNCVVSSDLARQSDNATWFFAKSLVPGEDRRYARVCCIATGGRTNDKIVLLRYDEHIKQAVHLALQDTWTTGISGSEDINAVGENLHEIKLNGYWGGTHVDGINTRKFICNMAGRMGGLSWRLIASTNLKGTSDSFFFIHDSSFTAHPNDFCMITLSKRDRFRLINCNQLAEPLKQAVTNSGQIMQDELDYYGCYELKISGNPWWCEGAEAIRARRSISRIFEMMGQNSWIPYTAIDVSRRLTDKTSFLFRKAQFPMNCKCACISLTSLNRIRLLDFPLDIGVPLRNAIYQTYPFGVEKEVNLHDTNLEINLQQDPWVVRPGDSTKGYAPYHARAMLGHMMRIAEQHGWYVSISADISAKYVGNRSYNSNDSYAIDTHSLYFVKLMMS